MLRMVEASESDEALMLRYAGGEVRAFEELYRRHEMKVWRFLYRSVADQASADELMQEVWIAVIASVERYRPTARFTTWLFTLAHHELVDRHRRSKRLGVEQEMVDLPADARDEPHRQAESSQYAQALIAAVEQLPAEQREAFLLQAEGDLSLEEIAEATGATFETVKSRLRYARNKLKQLLQEHV
jgi:RNA polymerase sigma factor (sigma-70 family)